MSMPYFPHFGKIILKKAALKKLFVSCHPTLGLQEESVGQDFFYFGEGQSHFQDLWLRCWIENYWVAPRFIQSFILPRLMK